MALVGIEFECEETEALERWERAEGSEHDSEVSRGEVTEDGNYYREIEIPLVMVPRFQDLVDDDPDATLKRLKK